MTTTTMSRQLDIDNPWPGLESFEENAQGFFFGRDREAELLLNHVRDAAVTVSVRAQRTREDVAATGRSVPRTPRGEFSADLCTHGTPTRFGGIVKPATPIGLRLDSGERARSAAALRCESLWEYLHRKDFELWSAHNYPLTPVIVLDQFEELFTLGERVPELVAGS